MKSNQLLILLSVSCDNLKRKFFLNSFSRYIFEFSEEATLPGALRLGLVRYGLKQDIKIDLTLLDDMNDFQNILEGILIKNIKERI